MKFYVLIFTLLLPFFSSCGTIQSRNNIAPSKCAQIFSGMRKCNDFGPAGCLIDLPFSLAADLVMVPWDLAKPFIMEDCKKKDYS